MNQAAPTLCIQVPTLETTVAIHRARKTDCLKGLQAEMVSAGVSGLVVGLSAKLGFSGNLAKR